MLILDDLLLDRYGDPVAYGKDDATHPLMGRFGNVMLVNGREADAYSLSVDRGSVVRFYLTNVANTRTFRWTIPNTQMKLIGSDIGRYEKESFVDAVTIAPAERYIVDVFFEKAGEYAISHESPLATYGLGTVTVAKEDADPAYVETFEDVRMNDDVITDIDQYRPQFDRPVDKTLRLDIETKGMMDHPMMMEHTDDGIEWEDTMQQMNVMSTKENTQWKLIDEDTKDVNMDIQWTFEKGSVAKIRIINDAESAHPMHHPIHFHGQRFLVLSLDGAKNENLVWKDTVLIPTGSTVDLLFDMSNPGDWMFHCHIAEHLTNGMMGLLTVE